MTDPRAALVELLRSEFRRGLNNPKTLSARVELCAAVAYADESDMMSTGNPGDAIRACLAEVEKGGR